MKWGKQTPLHAYGRIPIRNSIFIFMRLKGNPTSPTAEPTPTCRHRHADKVMQTRGKTEARSSYAHQHINQLVCVPLSIAVLTPLLQNAANHATDPAVVCWEESTPRYKNKAQLSRTALVCWLLQDLPCLPGTYSRHKETRSRD